VIAGEAALLKEVDEIAYLHKRRLDVRDLQAAPS
jgi:hypothetical protein